MDKKLIFLDSETCGLHSIMVLLQYAEGRDGEIKLYEIWKEPVHKTLDLFRYIADNIPVGFNMTFDWFHICKVFTLWKLLPGDWIPEEHIEEIAALEEQAMSGPCLKPWSTLDLLLYSRKGPYQSLMSRHPIRIKRVPTELAFQLAQELESRVSFDGIYFARRKNQDAPQWAVYDRELDDGVDPVFKDVVLSFNPAGGLKFLAEHVLGMPPKAHFNEIADLEFPVELGYAPRANAVSSAEKNWEVEELTDSGNVVIRYAWPALVKNHIEHWHSNERAREYAYDDIVYTRGLYYHWDEPAHGDNDSVLACQVAATRWHGFEIDTKGISELMVEAQKIVDNSPININKQSEVRSYMYEKMNDAERIILEETTRKEKLVEISNWVIEEEEICLECLGGGCAICDEKGVMPPGPHPASIRAKEILAVKFAYKEVELYEKLLQANKFHASFKITGTLSNRMSGGDGLNPQGIKNDPTVRKQFPLKWNGMTLVGGDFSAFEITLADAVYNDADLRKEIVTGRKLHALFGTLLYPGYTYDQIKDSADHPENYPQGDMYGKAKSGVFAMLYGGNAATLNRNLGVSMEVAEAAYAGWGKMFPGIEKARHRIVESFQPLKQPDGIGGKIFWGDPKEYVESLTGYKRYFTLENSVIKALYELANNIPKDWRQCKDTVIRSDKRGEQQAWGATSSAIFGAAFAIGEANVRAAANHEMQSSGAEITKELQRKIWDLQLPGEHEFVVCPINIHDEVLSVTHPDYVEPVKEIAGKVVDSFRPTVPLIGLEWNMDMASWAEKKAETEVKFTYNKEDFICV